MGARPLNRVIANEIKTKITDEILFGKLKNGGKLSIDFIKNAFVFKYK
jgi:ATP-dependent Clp protease ATP-binding subunit ClpA